MFKKGLCVVFLGAFLLVGMAWAVDYSADVMNVTRVGTQEEIVKAKAYFSGDKMRTEGKTDKGETAITIFRYDKKVFWILMPKEKMYMEQEIPLDELIVAMSELEKKKKIKVYRKIVGKAKISGILCDKYKITTKDLTEKKPKTYTMYQYVSRKHKKMIMKTVFEDGSYILFKNVKFKKQPAALFEIPKGYKKFEMKGMRIIEDEGEAVKGKEEGRGEEEIKEKIKEEMKIDIPIKMPW